MGYLRRDAAWLYDYVDRIREDARARGLDPTSRPERNVVAGARDLTNALVEQVAQAQTEAGDETSM
ncbi:hypothetical protein ACFP2T_46490 [Plantactinospora solaniradicis]|uniref:Uncharacterized protein n=1 Tax=Plantactinospora solaniradicis TaxID=1723736 RepID=A0ABW1KSD1_9ACTN